jgi:protein-S-isoprenylcysteine O-methyltransferase Ste14
MSDLPTLGPRGEGWVIGQFILVAMVGALGVPGLWSLPPTSAVGWIALALGLCLLAGGLAIGGLGIRALGAHLTALPRPRTDAELVETGIYRRIRHPVYVGVMLTSIGWAVAMASLPALAACLALGAWFDLKARREEAWLVEGFAGYEAYRARTHRFIPGLY